MRVTSNFSIFDNSELTLKELVNPGLGDGFHTTGFIGELKYKYRKPRNIINRMSDNLRKKMLGIISFVLGFLIFVAPFLWFIYQAF